MGKDIFGPFPVSRFDAGDTPQSFTDDFLKKLTEVISRNPRVNRVFAGNLHSFESRQEAIEELFQEMALRLLTTPVLRAFDDEQQLLERIRRVELPQLLNEFLRKKLPERYRLSRRIWRLIRDSERFSLISSDPRRHPSYSPSTLIGLREWREFRFGDLSVISEHGFQVPLRDRRIVGSLGESQLIISNTNLEEFIVQILQSVGGHLALGRLRGIILSTLYTCDPNFESLDSYASASGEILIGGIEPDPHEQALRMEQIKRLPEKEREFLSKLEGSCGRNEEKLNRVLEILRLCVLSDDPMQKRIAAKYLGISASLVSKDISLIRTICKSLDLHDEELRLMLRERLVRSVGRTDRKGGV